MIDAWYAMVERARAAWPEVEVEVQTFVDYLAERATPGVDALHAEDLYLACACAQGNTAAIAALDMHFVAGVAPSLARLGDETFIGEVKQLLRHKLLVPEPGARAKIMDYRGQGPLAAWLRVAAARIALNLHRRGAHDRPLAAEPERIDLPDLAADPELEILRVRYAPAFRAAFEEAVRSLEPKDRNLLRLHFVDNLNVDKVGSFYRVHRATAARWIVTVRERLLEEVRSRLREKLGLSDSEFDSMMNVVRSQLDLSLQTWLRDVPA